WSKNPVGETAVKNQKIGFVLKTTGLICALIVVVISVLTNEKAMIFLGTLLIVMFLLRIFVLPDRILKKQFLTVKESKLVEKWIRTTGFASEITVTEGKTKTVYQYGDIQNLTEDENYFYLWLTHNFVLRLLKEGFLTGTVEEFREFMQVYRK
ncbi:MAG: YcxB family protein, partial [Clostridiales bacterium]|nr:YcxB family protein [Clostridiales bacterium]